MNIASALGKISARLFEPARRNFEYFKDRQIPFAIFAVIGFPLYYYIWHDLFPQPYENLPLRLLGSAIFLPVVFVRYWSTSIKRYLMWYWYGGILFALPFFFPFMTLKNGISTVWVESTLAATFLMVLLLDWFTMLMFFVIGTGLALLAYYLTTDAPQLPSVALIHLMIILFAMVFGTISNYASEVVRVEQQRAMLATAASIAHELRTPLLGIRTGAAGLRNYLPALIDAYWLAHRNHLPVPSIRTAHINAMKGVLDRIEAEANYSNAIIDMLITNVRMFKSDDRELVACSMTQCVDTALDRYPFTDKERALVSWKPDEDFVFRGSHLLMVHVLFNLLKNALWHVAKAGKGSITIDLECSTNGNRLIFLDTGSGVPPEMLPHIFQRFYSSSVANDSVIGSGIGLAFCLDVVQAFGGTMKCTSVFGEFTQFALTFPPLPK
jgi:two-component system CAI-1 autoinducer sensor kinase/phosphatase CqsS